MWCPSHFFVRFDVKVDRDRANHIKYSQAWHRWADDAEPERSHAPEKSHNTLTWVVSRRTSTMRLLRPLQVAREGGRGDAEKGGEGQGAAGDAGSEGKKKKSKKKGWSNFGGEKAGEACID